MNFGYNFGVPRSEQEHSSQEGTNDDNNNNNNASAESQNSEYSSIDFSKIPPPTFKFGQFGQVSADSVNSDNVNNDNINNISTSNGDDDSFLAEPSMSAGQFDAAFNLPTENAVFSPSNSAESLKSSSVKSVPVLVEETLEEPVYLEEPTPHSVEELMKATVDGDTSALMPEFFEAHESTEEPAHTIQELLKTEDGGVAMDSWENIDEEEIKAAEVEFFETEEFVSNGDEEESEAEPKPQPIIKPKPVFVEHSEEESESDYSEPVEEDGPVIVELERHEFEQLVEAGAETEPVAEVKAVEKKTKASAATKAKAKAAPKSPAASKAKAATVSKAKAAPKSPKKEKVTEESVVLTEGRGKRERKTVERLSDSVIQPTKTVTEKVPAIPAGTGMKLGDIEVINHALGRKTSADKVVIMLHKVLFNRLGESAHRKAGIRAFCGDESANYETRLKKYTNAELLELTQFLGLTSAKEKALIAARISNFLIKPNLESVKFTAKGERILKKAKKTTKPKPARSSKRINPDADKKPLGRPPKGSKKEEYLTPETVDSDVESEVEREVLGELKKE